MVPYIVYKTIHLIGIFMVLMGLAGLLVQSAGSAPEWRKPAAITHGVGLLLTLLGGFGMLARMFIIWPWPNWVVAKVAIWLTMGGLIAVIRRKPELSKPLWWATLGLGAMAVGVVLYKPF